MAKEKIWLSSPHMSGREFEFVREAFDTNWISPVGPHIAAFERDLAAYTGSAHCAALSSGTAAIHLALIILGVKPGDEVICSSFTFSGSCNPITYVGARPVFVDSETTTWNMDPALLRTAIADRIAKTGKKPAAIIMVHLYGMPGKIDEIVRICEENDIPLVEDAAEALGSTFHGSKLGTFGDIGILSFNGNKIITTSGGGALLSDSAAVVERARFLATQARDPAPHYEHTVIGFNYRLSNVCAGIGRGQMTVLDQRVSERRAVYDFYLENLQKWKQIEFLKEPEGSFSNRWLTTVLLPEGDNERLRVSLEAENIESRPLWKPMHLQPVFRDCPYYGNGVSDNLFARGLCLPSGTNLTQGQKDRILASLFDWCRNF